MNIRVQGNGVFSTRPKPAESLFPITNKLIRVMKLTAFLLLLGVLQVSAKSYAQKVTITREPLSIKEVFRQIKQQTGLEFFYNDALLDASELVKVTAVNRPYNEVLDQCLAPKGLTYTLKNNVIIIKRKEVEVLQAAAPVVYEGKVIDSTASPVANATITIKGKQQKVVTTDSKGHFSIQAEAHDVLTVSCVGFVTSTYIVGDPGKTIVILLRASVSELDEMIVQAYGKTTRRLTTSDIAKVSGDEISKQLVTDPITALQGKVPGLEISPQSGYEGGVVKVQLRGRSVVNNNMTSEPLYIVDGVPLTVSEVNPSPNLQGNNSNVSQALSRGIDQNGLSPATGQNMMYSINPADIESIEVLKDADATAIYGSRGANGVILISTKKGKPGKNKADISFSQGITGITRQWNLLNTHDYLAMRREAFKNDGITPTTSNAPELMLFDTTRDFNWQKFLWGGKGKWTNVQAGLSGGTGQTSYRMAAGYNSKSDITTFSGNNGRASFSVNLNTKSLNQRFTVGLSANYSYTFQNQIAVVGLGTQMPDAPPVFDSAGNLNYKAWDQAGVTFPFSVLKQPYNSKTNFLTTNLTLTYTLLKGLVARASLGYNNSTNFQTRETPIASQDTYKNTKVTGTSYFGTNRNNNWIIEPQLEYNTSVGSEGKLNLLVGGTVQDNTTIASMVTGQGYTSDQMLNSISNAVTVTATENYALYKYAGAFARATYNLKNRYILNLNGRRDGSSRFGADSRFGNFWAVGAAWVMSDESWIRSRLPESISFLKLRGSYGVTGSDAVGNYKYLSQWGNLSPVLAGYDSVAALTPQIQPNSNFHWQVNRKTEIGLDIAFLNDKITGSFAYYTNRCDNQLVSFPTPAFSGFSSVVANSPADIRNQGIEATVTAQVMAGKKFSWSASFNIGKNQNKLLNYPHLDLSPYYGRYKIGQSVDNAYVFKYTGVDPLTGQYTFYDANGDGKINSVNNKPTGTGLDDRVATLYLAPKYFGGFTNNFTYKNWQLGLFFSFRKQLGRSGFTYSGTNDNISYYQYNNRWSHPGQTARFSRVTTVATTSDQLYLGSDAVYTDASYIRFQNIALSWSLPANVAKKLGFNGIAASLSAQNIFVLTRFQGGDPDAASVGGMPMTRTGAAGLSFTF